VTSKFEISIETLVRSEKHEHSNRSEQLLSPFRADAKLLAIAEEGFHKDNIFSLKVLRLFNEINGWGWLFTFAGEYAGRNTIRHIQVELPMTMYSDWIHVQCKPQYGMEFLEILPKVARQFSHPRSLIVLMQHNADTGRSIINRRDGNDVEPCRAYAL